MVSKTNKKKVDTYCEFQDVTFPCTVECIHQPNRIEVLEDERYVCVDKCHNNLVILDSRGRELLFDKKWFVLVNE